MAEVLAVSPSVAEVKLVLSSPKSTPAPAAEEYIFRSPLPDIDIPDQMTLPEYIFQNASLYPDKTCLVDHFSSMEYTYSEVQTLCKRISVGLSNIGIAQGDVVMLLLPNCAEFVLLLLGLATRGAAATTANTFNKPPEVDKQVKSSKARLIATQAALVGKLENAIDPSVRFLTIDDRLEGHLHISDILQANENEFVAPEILPTDVVALPFSSGTTGLPKGVMLTHQSLITDIAQHVDGENPNFYLTPDDVVLCVLPLIHIFSASVLFASLRAGSAVVIMQKFDVVAFLQVIQKFRISVMALVPPIVLGVTRCPIVDEFDLSSVRTVLSGAAPMGKALEDKLRSKMPNAVIGQGYGMTEAGPVITMCPSFAKIPIPVKPGSCGTVVRNAELKVVDLENGKSLPRNQSGEICIRGNQIMKGYLNNPEGTALTIDKDGWLHSGDVGYVDDDDQIFLVDRVKEIIKYKGYQVPPAELESLLIAHPAIQDAAVVPELDEAAGELPVAFVVRAKGSDITEREIKDYISPKVVFYKRICKVYFVDAIPKSPTGKILRKDLKNRLAEEAMLRKTE